MPWMSGCGWWWKELIVQFWVFPIQRSLSFLVLPICQNQQALFIFRAHLSSFLHLWALDIYTLGLTDCFSRDRYDPLYPGNLAWLIILTGFPPHPPQFYWNMVGKNCVHLRCAAQCVDTHIYCEIYCFWNVCLQCDIRKRPDFRVR